MVAAGSRVSIEYTLTLDNGSVADTNVGKAPLTFEHGASQVLAGLENGLLGLSAGDSKKVSLSAAEGYGEINPEAFQSVATSAIPEDSRVVGALLMAQNPNGQQRPVRVHEIKGEEIVLNLNHPLAGEALHFQVKVLAVD